MSDVQEYAAHLSQVIGPRPAGTEEEQQASFFIDEVLQEAGLDVRTEEFRCNLNYRVPRAICCLFTVILGFLSLFLSMLVLPAMVICLVTAVLFVLDCFEISPFASFGNKGLSQNIVARYEPPVQTSAAGAGGRAQRRRKVILVAHYDSGKVRRELKAPILGVLHIIRWVELGAMVLVPLALIIRLFSGENSGPLVMFTSVLTIIGIIGALLVLLAFVTHRISAYSDGANNNASGVAVMLDVAKRISESRDSASPSATMHGALEAYAAGVVPQGAELVYEQDSELEVLEDGSAPAASPADTLGIAEQQAALGALGADGVARVAQAAEQAAAGMVPSIAEQRATIVEEDAVIEVQSGSQVDGAAGMQEAASAQGTAASYAVPTSQPAQLSATDSGDGDMGEQQSLANGNAASGSLPPISAAGTAGAVAASAADVAGAADTAASLFASASKEPSVPDWYKRAMSKANKSESKAAPDPSKRSKFSDALDAAVAASRPEPEPVNPSGLSSDAEQRLQAMRESIMAGRPLSEATGTIEEGLADMVDAIEDGEAAQVAAEVESIAAEPSPAHLQGVDGYLSSATSAPNYEAEQGTDAADLGQAAHGKQAAQGQAQASRKTAKRIISTDAQPAVSASSAQKEPRKKRSILLPSLTGALKAVSASDESGGADEAASSTSAGNDADVARIAARNANKLKKANLAVSLPTLTEDRTASTSSMSSETGSLEPITPEEKAAAAKSSTAAAAHAQLSPNEEIQMLEAEAVPRKRKSANPDATISISQVGSFANAGMTGAFEPLSSDFVADMSAEDIYIDDADDSGYEENFTEHGALAGPGYVEMPKSRRERVFGKLRRKGKGQDSLSFSEAVGIEEGYDARQVGKDRGGWESFRQGGGRGSSTGSNDAWGDDDWNGGAYGGSYTGESHDRDVYGGAYDGGYDDVYEEELDIYEDPIGYDDRDDYDEGYDSRSENARLGSAPENPSGRAGSRNPRNNRDGQDQSQKRRPSRNPRASRYMAESREEIREFHDGPVQLEVWFVALGAELADNAGMKSFIAEHTNDLRGAMIVDIDALGAGELTMIEREGTYRTTSMSSRLKRYVHKAGDALGLRVGTISMPWESSAAYVAERHGCQTLHLAGIKDGKPAYMAEADDVMSNLDPQLMEENAAFIMEFIRGI